MSRIRSIKPEYWTSGQVMECSRDSRLLFIGLWNFCDDTGRFPNSPKQIKALVFPGDDDLTADTIRRMIDELSANGLLTLYAVDGKPFIQVSGWKHQKIDKPQPSKYPAPVAEHSPTIQRTVSTEGSGEERIGSDNSLSAREAIANFRAAIVQTYRVAGSATIPDTSLAAVWVERGYSQTVCLATIEATVRRKPSVGLKYIEPIIVDALAAPQPRAASTGPPGQTPRKSASQIAAELNAKSHERSYDDGQILDLAATAA